MKISYTDQDVANAAKRDKLKEGTMRFVLADIKRQISKDNGHLMLVGSYRALSDPGDAGSTTGPKANNYLCLPFRNPDREDHVPNKFFARNTNQWLAAHVPEEVPAVPQKTVDGLLFKGEAIEFKDSEAAYKEALDATFEKASQLWEDESNEGLEALKGSAVFADLYYQKNEATGVVSDFPSFNNFRAELRDGEECLSGDLMDTASTEAVVETLSKVKSTKVAKAIPAKAAKKPVNGKKK